MHPLSLLFGGRSPRVRGSRHGHGLDYAARGSIPAGAGEPLRTVLTCGRGRVDPRGCGGASLGAHCRTKRPGRSPRVRGSRPPPRARRRARGSIPAGAGEPAPERTARFLFRVDPRGCGGAACRPAITGSWSGRSPRVRGSPEQLIVRDAPLGSIPAGAGEPRASRPRPAATRVDPRGCGGAIRLVTDCSILLGRSPRVRGSLVFGFPGVILFGSIPAGAGEPTMIRQ